MQNIEVTPDGRGRRCAVGRGGISATLIESSARMVGMGGMAYIHTLQLRYPRFILAEVNTHRALSKSSGSSRAIPVAKMLEQVRKDPAMPIHWGKNQPGMQANEQLEGMSLSATKWAWGQAADGAAKLAEEMSAAGAHKQIANRILEPFQFMNTVVTGTDWDNLFELRCHKDAQPEFQELAMCMRAVIKSAEKDGCTLRLNSTTDDPFKADQEAWHLPYITKDERSKFVLPMLLAGSAARCARASYMTHDNQTPSIENDVGLFIRLVGARPQHASPIEHQALAFGGPHAKSGNFHNWTQFRGLLNIGSPKWIQFIQSHTGTVAA